MSRWQVRVLHGPPFLKIPVKNYQLIEHTADIGIKTAGKDLKAVFKNAAVAMFEIIAWKSGAKIKKPVSVTIKQKADNTEDLLVIWLNELLSLSAIKEVIFDKFRINKLNKGTIEATVSGTSIKNYLPKTEIKAATYHEIKVRKVKAGWQAQVIFDV